MSRVTVFKETELRYKTIEYILENGFSEITVRKLAQYCGCSTQPFYNSFGNINRLKNQVVVIEVRHFERFLQDDDPTDLTELVMTLVKFNKQYPKHFQHFFLESKSAYESLRDIIHVYFIHLTKRENYDFSTDQYFSSFWFLAIGCVITKAKLSDIHSYVSMFNDLNISSQSSNAL